MVKAKNIIKIKKESEKYEELRDKETDLIKKLKYEVRVLQLKGKVFVDRYINNIPVERLIDKYGVSRSTLYKMLGRATEAFKVESIFKTYILIYILYCIIMEWGGVNLLDKISKLVIAIPSIITLIGVLGKVSYNLFIESVKYKYKRVPAQQTTIGIIFNTILCIVVIVDILGIFLLFAALIIGFIKGKFIGNITSSNVSETAEKSITLLIMIFILVMLIYLIHTFSKLRIEYNNKLNGLIHNKIKRIMFVFILGNVALWGILALLLIILIIYTIKEGIAIKSNEGILIFESVLTEIDYNFVFTGSVTTILCVTLFMISLSLIEIINSINEDSTYSLITKDRVISCKCYLEYKEHYLIIDGNIERHIKRDDVIEIERTSLNRQKKKKYKKKEKHNLRKNTNVKDNKISSINDFINT